MRHFIALAVCTAAGLASASPPASPPSARHPPAADPHGVWGITHIDGCSVDALSVTLGYLPPGRWVWRVRGEPALTGVYRVNGGRVTHAYTGGRRLWPADAHAGGTDRLTLTPVETDSEYHLRKRK